MAGQARNRPPTTGPNSLLIKPVQTVGNAADRSFLKAHDLHGKIRRRFITHAGYGVGDSPPVLAIHAARARIQEAFVREADQEPQTLNQINGWLSRIEG